MSRTRDPQPGDEPVPVAPIPPGIPDDAPELVDLSRAELDAEAAARGLDVASLDGSGVDGRVVMDDLVEALEDFPVPPVGRPPLIALAESAAITLTPQQED